MRSIMEKSLNLDYVKLNTKWWAAVFIKFTNLVWMIVDQNFYGTYITILYPTASATAESENWTYGYLYRYVTFHEMFAH